MKTPFFQIIVMQVHTDREEYAACRLTPDLVNTKHDIF